MLYYSHHFGLRHHSLGTDVLYVRSLRHVPAFQPPYGIMRLTYLFKAQNVLHLYIGCVNGNQNNKA